MIKKHWYKIEDYLFKTRYKHQYQKCLKSNEEYEKTHEFIWGIKSYDDLSYGSEASLYSMNDIDIIYNITNRKYTISIETIYSFDNGIEGAKIYIKSLLDKLTDWMKENNYNTEKHLALYEAFTEGQNIKSEFDTLEDLYACFKLYVIGFLNT